MGVCNTPLRRSTPLHTPLHTPLTTMRYFTEISYRGTDFHGWQMQPNAVSLQSTIQDAMSLILREQISITGCGRTDAGVHARQYYFHFDYEKPLPENFRFSLNNVLPRSISVSRLIEVKPDAHARFDAVYRSYEYYIHFQKDPFLDGLSTYWPKAKNFDLELLQETADILVQYSEFYPFSKSNTDVKTMHCVLKRVRWRKEPKTGQLVFYIASDRFLRGMVRLIVGMCFNVAEGKITQKQVHDALEQQTRLNRSFSAPPTGLYLHEVWYTYI